MDLTWIWTALASVAAVLSSIWSGWQAFRSRSVFGQYEQWTRIRDDHPSDVHLREYAASRMRESVIELAARAESAKVRRWQWIVIVLGLAIAVIAMLASGGAISQSAGVWIGLSIAGIIFAADGLVARARRRARRAIYGIVARPRADGAAAG